MENNCHVEPIYKTVAPEERESTTQIMLTVQGMGCRNCATRVQNSLIQVKGVTDAEVSHISGIAEVIFSPSLTTQMELLEAVARAGGDGRHEYRALIYG